MAATFPLAVGMIYGPAFPSAVELRRARMDLALYARWEGFTLFEAFDFDDRSQDRASARQFILDLAGRVRFSALFVAGPPEWGIVHELAEAANLLVYFSPELEPGSGSGPQPESERRRGAEATVGSWLGRRRAGIPVQARRL